jgi:hypothetical protein
MRFQRTPVTASRAPVLLKIDAASAFKPAVSVNGSERGKLK